MDVMVLGAGMMGRAITFDLTRHSNFDNITVADKDKQKIQMTLNFLRDKNIGSVTLDVGEKEKVKKHFKNHDVVISALPFTYNLALTEMSIETQTHLLDLGGNTGVVEKQRSFSKEAEKNDVTIVPDCGLAPGLTSVITRDIVEELDSVDYVKIRVGGLPQDPKPPFGYQIVFSPYGLINEYVEESIVLDHGRVIKKQSMTEVEEIDFPEPFGKMEAFLTSGGSSTLPYTYRDKIRYLDYKTIRYPGHLERFKPILDLGLADEKIIKIGSTEVAPRDILAEVLLRNLPQNEKDVVLLKVYGEGIKKSSKGIEEKKFLEYTMIDYYDEENNVTAMMRTTGYPVSIVAQMIENNTIDKKGVFSPEEVVPCKPFFRELKKRGIEISKRIEVKCL